MNFLYPVKLTPEREAGGYAVTFPDVPEAITEGDDRAEALDMAVDALVAALGFHVEARRPIPQPSLAYGGDVVVVPPLAAAKLALYEAMREAGMTRVALAKELGVAEGAVRRLLDLDHRSHIGQVEAALAVLGKRLVIDVRAAA